MGHEGGGEPDDGGVLDQDVLERRELRAEAIAGSGLQLREAVGHAEMEELHELRGEPVVEAGVAVKRLGGPLVVDVAELVEGALEVDAGLEGHGPEEGDRIDLTVAANEPALLGEAHESFRREEFEQGVLEEGRGKRIPGSSRGCAHPGGSGHEV